MPSCWLIRRQTGAYLIAGHDLKSHHLMTTHAVPCCRLEQSLAPANANLAYVYQAQQAPLRTCISSRQALPSPGRSASPLAFWYQHCPKLLTRPCHVLLQSKLCLIAY